MEEELGQESTSKPDAMIETGDGSAMSELSEREQKRLEEFQGLIDCVLELDPKKYAQPWTDDMLLSMRALLVKSVNSYPKKSRPMIHLFRKFLFDNGQLIAMAAVAHAHAAAKKGEKESLIARPSFSDLAKAEGSRNE